MNELLVEQERVKVLNTAYLELPCLTVNKTGFKYVANTEVNNQDTEDAEGEDEDGAESKVSNEVKVRKCRLELILEYDSA